MNKSNALFAVVSHFVQQAHADETITFDVSLLSLVLVDMQQASFR